MRYSVSPITRPAANVSPSRNPPPPPFEHGATEGQSMGYLFRGEGFDDVANTVHC